MPFISLGRGFNDEYMVSDFANAVYGGDEAKARAMLAQDPSLRNDEMALYLALRLDRRALFIHFVESGFPIPDGLYAKVLYENPEYLQLLPPNPSAIKAARATLAQSRLNHEFLEDEPSLENVKAALAEGADPKVAKFVAHHLVDFKPIHLAAKRASLEIIEFLIQSGADPDETAPDGKNPIRVILENENRTSQERRAARKLFQRLGSEPRPALGFWDRWNLFWGKPISYWRDRN